MNVLKTAEKKKFIEEFEERCLAWALEKMKPKLNTELAAFIHSHSGLNFFSSVYKRGQF